MTMHRLLRQVTHTTLWLALLLVIAAVPSFAPAGAVSAADAARLPSVEVAVLAAAGDPYLPLAQEIAAAENAPLYNTPADAFEAGPRFLLWVVAPSRLSDQVMTDFARAWLDRGFATAPGIITASSLEQARALWQRAGQARADRLYIANGEFPSAQFFTPQLRGLTAGEAAAEQPLTLESLRAALQQADYLSFSGHGSGAYLRLDEHTTLRAADVPSLSPLVVSTDSCQTVRPWVKNSIALAFVDRGAAAYTGFAYSPNAGYLLGAYDGLPLRYTWPGFTIGQTLLVQTVGSLRSFAALPFHFMLGDPRTALQKTPVYRLADERETPAGRELAYTGAPAGVIPVRIEGGAQYSFVRVSHEVAASDHDPFYNARLITKNIGADKYVLFEHRGGDFTVELRRRPPLVWTVLDPVSDALDHTLLFLQQNGGDWISLGVGASGALIVAWRLWRKRSGLAALWPAVLAGLLLAGLHGLYGILRASHTTINTKPVLFGPLPVVATFVLAASGACLFSQARSRRGQAAALVLALAPCWLPALINAGMWLFVNLVAAPEVGATLYTYLSSLLPLLAALIELPLLVVVFGVVRRKTS